MLPFEAGLTVTLGLRDSKVTDVAIVSTRLVQASRLLAGRDPVQVTTLLPTLYALCGTAQALAGAAAVEDALGLLPSPLQRMARRFLLLLEILTEHSFSILRDWPALLDESPDLSPARLLRPLVHNARRSLYPDGDWARPGGGRLEVDAVALGMILPPLKALLAHIFAGSVDQIVDSPSLFDTWCEHGDGLPARLLRRVRQSGLGGFGAAASHFMPAEGPADVGERLAADDGGRYLARPDYHGRVLETGSLSRQHAHPLVAGLLAQYGSGLLPRFAARMAEIAAALQEAEDLVQDLSAEAVPPPSPGGSGIGLGRVDAARGLLIHGVTLKEGRVSTYKILAPTEWNFHPAGPLAAGLTGARDDDGLIWRARLLAAALDPCVACRFEVAQYA
ncbi:Ni,Fe-hydrogenase I large subunit [Candidatus Terasakiella magnetica]|nr:Ni,Fe-hydrogenase I large subunit [Candidatus Terasakiella magnetica]